MTPKEKETMDAYRRQWENEEEIRKEACIDFAKWLAKDWMSIWVVDKWMWENLHALKPDNYKYHDMYYTEEELYKIYLQEANG